jgi:hypothetical protein
MINIIKKIFGEKWYCRAFHTSYGVGDKQYHCPKCNITQWRCETIFPM